MTPIVLLHGWGFPGAVFSPLIKQLGEDFDVRITDRAGYGENSTTENTPVLAQLDEPALVVGWSLGGINALQLALQQPEKISGLFLLATTPCFVNRPDWPSGMDATVFEDFRKQVIDDPAAAMQQFVRLNAGHKADRACLSVLTAQSGRVTAEALQQGLDELAETDLRNAVAEIEPPVLLLHATDDRVVPAAAGRWLQETIADTEYVEFSSGGHAFFLQHAEAVAKHIRAMT